MDVIQLISSEAIKPSAITPSAKTLKSFKLGDAKESLISASSFYVPLTLFYPAKLKTSYNAGLERAHSLKLSLSQTLTSFCTLAGKIRFGSSGVSIDCDDSGVWFVEARVKCHMSRFLKRPDFTLMDGFLHVEENKDVGFHVAKIQVNIFECGGIAVSVLISQFVDGVISLSDFLKVWADSTKVLSCQNGRTMRLDYVGFNRISLMQRRCFSKEKAVTRRLIFDSEAIASLKAITMSSGVPNPTTIEAVSSLIWKCIMDSVTNKSSNGSYKSCALTLSTRTRRVVAAMCKNEMKTNLHDLVHQIRGAITKGTNSCLEFEDEHLDYLICYGWCTSGLYEVDFGWGRPVWVTSTGSSLSNISGHQFSNSVVLVETRWGDGIEAWITLDEKRMVDLVHNHELLTFASASF